MPVPDETEAIRARARRRAAARKFRPQRIKTLLVAEAPPAALDRYFYFTDVREQDSLFRYVCRGALGKEPTRENKPHMLAELREKGAFLIDLSPDPLGSQPLRAFVPNLVRRCGQLDPRRIILIKVTVYDAAYRALVDAGLPVINERIPFPGSGQQRRFLSAFGRALSRQTQQDRAGAASPRLPVPSEETPRTESDLATSAGGHRSRFTSASGHAARCRPGL
jgi:hypothetical protein